MPLLAGVKDEAAGQPVQGVEPAARSQPSSGGPSARGMLLNQQLHYHQLSQCSVTSSGFPHQNSHVVAPQPHSPTAPGMIHGHCLQMSTWRYVLWASASQQHLRLCIDPIGVSYRVAYLRVESVGIQDALTVEHTHRTRVIATDSLCAMCMISKHLRCPSLNRGSRVVAQ